MLRRRRKLKREAKLGNVSAKELADINAQLDTLGAKRPGALKEALRLAVDVASRTLSARWCTSSTAATRRRTARRR